MFHNQYFVESKKVFFVAHLDMDTFKDGTF